MGIDTFCMPLYKLLMKQKQNKKSVSASPALSQLNYSTVNLEAVP